MIDMIDAVAHKANFTYKLYMPSGMGASCLPEPIAKDDSEDMYNAKYRSQFSKFVVVSCGSLVLCLRRPRGSTPLCPFTFQ